MNFTIELDKSQTERLIQLLGQMPTDSGAWITYVEVVRQVQAQAQARARTNQMREVENNGQDPASSVPVSGEQLV